MNLERKSLEEILSIYLLSGELSTIARVKELLLLAIPDREHLTQLVAYTKNLNLVQEEFLSLIGSLKNYLGKLRVKQKSIISNELESLVQEKGYTKSERELLLYRENSIIDISNKVNDFESIVYYCENLQWNLINLSKFVIK